MDKKKTKILFGALGVIAFFILFLMMYNQGGGGTYYHWRRTYDEDKKNPFDTYIIFNLLKSSSETGEMIISEKSFKHFSWENEEPLNYIFIGDQAYYAEEDIAALLDFVEEGNNVFIAQEYINVLLYDQALGFDSTNLHLAEHQTNQFISCIGLEECYTFDYIDELADTVGHEWYYFYGLPYNDHIEYLGRVDGKEVNFYRTRYGNGNFYFHSNPLLFTNLYMTDSLTWNYANKIFGYMPGQHYYWDRHAYLNLSELNSDIYQNPLKHILGNRSFLWAWYMMLLLVVLFLILNSKRRQRNIPFTESNENSTIEFTETIGQLYFKEQNHYKIIKLMMKMFLFNLYNRYKIPVHKTRDKSTLKRLSQKTGVDNKRIIHILDKYNSLAGKAFAESEDLIYLYQQINNYQNSCK